MRFRTTQKSERFVLAAAAAAALLLHVTAFWIFGNLFGRDPTAPKQNALDDVQAPQKVSAKKISKNEWEKNRQIAGRIPPPSHKIIPTKKSDSPEEKKSPPPVKKEPERVSGTIVAVAEGNHKRPKDSKFLSETNNSVERETISRHRRTNYAARAAKPTASPESSASSGAQAPAEISEANHLSSQPLRGNGGDGSDEKPKSEAVSDNPGGTREAANLKPPEKTRSTIFEGLSNIPLRFKIQSGNLPSENSQPEGNKADFHGSGLRREKVEASAGMSGTESGSGLALKPSNAFTSKFLNAGPMADISLSSGVPEGEGTYLNTVQWKHAGFFNRIKDVVGSHWDPQSVIALNDPSGKTYLYKDRCTKVSVTLDNDGTVKNSRIIHKSGAPFLDSEAENAFRRSEAFPHPPEALQDENGEINFNFTFCVITSKKI